ncbi:hypothetical protein MUB16_22510 [Priestia sp. OVL9]|nr:hypothetical protein [Priestia sp. OVL9]
MDIMTNESFYKNSYSMYRSSANNRELIIPSIIAKELFQLLKDRSFIFIHDGHSYENIILAESSAPFSFQLNKHPQLDLS